jgi:hypothetical protein
MASLVFLLGLAAALFALGFLTKRRFGMLGLGLAAGSVLSAHWATTLTPFIEQQGLVIVAPPLSIIVQTLLLLLPAFAFLFSGPTYSGTWPKILSAIAFSVLALALLIEPLGSTLKLDGGAQATFNIVKQYQSAVIVVLLMAVTIDAFLIKIPKDKKA